MAEYGQASTHNPHPTHLASSTEAIVASVMNLSFEIIVHALAAAAYAWEIVSVMFLGEWAIPARKTPSVAKSTGRNFT